MPYPAITSAQPVTGAEALTARLWSSIEGIFAEILAHPFIAGLTDGSLPEDAFRFYVVQDALYLTRYARALSLCAAKAPRDEAIRMFNEHAAGAIAVERSLHESFFAEFGISPGDVAATPLAPANLAYTSYLLAVAYGGSFAEALGAVLPCYWIYWEVGKALLAKGSPNRLYQRWIDTYGGDEFAAIVQAVLDLTDALAPELGPADQRAMAEHFVMTSRYEWLFWDMGYRQERWPGAVAPGR
jgi:thiaminase/transcriptional activator TenA